ncbi:MAG: DUF4157 domain-containing protein [Thermoanaerobaculia bacterium]
MASSWFSPGSNVLQASFLGGRPGPALQASLSPATAGLARTRVMPLPATVVLARSAGLPLAAEDRGELEELFRADFSHVRVHVDPVVQRLGALAVTSGSNLYFAPGHFLPGSPHGRRLLGHELAHVLQQRAGRVRNPLPGGLAIVHDEGLEAEAEAFGLRAATALSRRGLVRVDGGCGCGCGGRCGGGCGCGGSCGGGCGHGSAQARLAPGGWGLMGAGEVVQGALVIGGRRINPPRRGNYHAKGLTERQASKHFSAGLTKPVFKKKFERCPIGTRPRGRNWRRTMWDGSQRPGWNLAAQGILPGICALCGAAATDRDHIVPYRRYISDNANPRVFCDGSCHFVGVSMADATALSNALANLRPLCAACNGAKAALDRADPFNRDDPPTLVGACPNAPAGCPACGRICL